MSGLPRGLKSQSRVRPPHHLAGTLCGGLEHVPWLCPGPPVPPASSCPGVWPALDAEERLRCPRTPMERLVRCFANRELHQDGHGAAGGCNLPATAAQSPPDPPANPDTSCLQQRRAETPHPQTPLLRSGGSTAGYHGSALPSDAAQEDRAALWCPRVLSRMLVQEGRRGREYLELGFYPCPHWGPCGHSNTV